MCMCVCTKIHIRTQVYTRILKYPYTLSTLTCKQVKVYEPVYVHVHYIYMYIYKQTNIYVHM